MKTTKLEKAVVYLAIFVSLVFIPINYDALIIPKVLLIFILALYLLPQVLTNYKILVSNSSLKILMVVSSLIVIQMIIVMVLSEAPFVQEFYGRTGRGLGFATFFSFLIILIFVSINSEFEKSKIFIFGLVISGLLSSSYALLQRFGLDPFNWNSRTNGIIGTLGNPNFQSSFAAMVLIPTFIYSWQKSLRYLIMPVALSLLIATIYFTQSTQGYITSIAAFYVFIQIFLWYRSKILFYTLAFFGFIFSLFAISGMLNYGFLSKYLYKVSVQSRGDFWRSAFTGANSNPVFGVGIDSFGDSYLKYRDVTALNHKFNEITDNAHNYLLEFSVTGGYPLALLHLSLIILTLYCFVSLQIRINRFNIETAGLFSAWVVFQLQSVISPGTVTLILWNALISGYFIGAQRNVTETAIGSVKKAKSTFDVKKQVGALLVICGLFIMYPLFNSDRILREAVIKRDANLVMTALKTFPESTVRYNIFGQELLRSNLPVQALEIAREATLFNPNAVSAWALIFANPQASTEERRYARDQILRLDPLNPEVSKFPIE